MSNPPVYLRKHGSGDFDSPPKARIYSRGPMAGVPDRDNPWRGYSTGLGVSVTMLAGVAVWGVIGYLVDKLLGTPKVFTALGMIVGAVGAGYLIYLRHGRENDQNR
jgi:ATP synthase protein I